MPRVLAPIERTNTIDILDGKTEQLSTVENFRQTKLIHRVMRHVKSEKGNLHRVSSHDTEANPTAQNQLCKMPVEVIVLVYRNLDSIRDVLDLSSVCHLLSSVWKLDTYGILHQVMGRQLVSYDMARTLAAAQLQYLAYHKISQEQRGPNKRYRKAVDGLIGWVPLRGDFIELAAQDARYERAIFDRSSKHVNLSERLGLDDSRFSTKFSQSSEKEHLNAVQQAEWVLQNEKEALWFLDYELPSMRDQDILEDGPWDYVQSYYVIRLCILGCFFPQIRTATEVLLNCLDASQLAGCEQIFRWLSDRTKMVFNSKCERAVGGVGAPDMEEAPGEEWSEVYKMVGKAYKKATKDS